MPLVTPGPAVSTARPGPALQLGHRLGGEDGRLLVPHVDDADAAVVRRVVEREDVPAGEREQLASRRTPAAPASASCPP